jgi:hypothetical protein
MFAVISQHSKTRWNIYEIDIDIDIDIDIEIDIEIVILNAIAEIDIDLVSLNFKMLFVLPLSKRMSKWYFDFFPALR